MSVEWVTIGPCKLACGDCLEILPTLDAGSVDAVVTDPPYGVSENSSRRLHAYKNPSKSGGKIGWTNWGRATSYGDTRWDDKPLTSEQWSECRRIADKQIVFGMNHLFAVLGKSGSALVWDKKCRNGWRDFFSDCELIWCSIVQPDRMHRQTWMGAIRQGESDKRVHPTQKPVALMEWCLSFLPEGCTVVDPFMGSGTTGIACVKTARKFIGIEKEPKYFDIACKRIEKAVADTALLSGVA